MSSDLNEKEHETELILESDIIFGGIKLYLRQSHEMLSDASTLKILELLICQSQQVFGQRAQRKIKKYQTCSTPNCWNVQKVKIGIQKQQKCASCSKKGQKSYFIFMSSVFFFFTLFLTNLLLNL